MPDHDDKPGGNQLVTCEPDAGALSRRATRLGLSIGGGVLSLAALQQPVLAQSCSGVGVETPGGQAMINPGYDTVGCIIIGGGDALLGQNGQVTPLVPLGAPTGRTTYTYDALGRLPSETDSLGTTTMTYDFASRVTSADAMGHVTTYTYDYGAGRGELTTVTDPSSHVTTYQYDPVNHLTNVMGPSGTYTYQYDPGEVIQTDPLGHVTTYIYDAAGSLETIDAMGQLTTYIYDAAGALEEADVSGNVTTYIYDTDNQLTSLVDPLGHITTFVYDAVNRLSVDNGNSDSDTTFGYASQIPEPSTLALLLSGLVGWARLRRRR